MSFTIAEVLISKENIVYYVHEVLRLGKQGISNINFPICGVGIEAVAWSADIGR